MTVQSAAQIRTPLPVLLAAVVVVLSAVVTGSGAVYFVFFHDPLIGAGDLAFVIAFLALKATVVAAAAGLVRGRRPAWRFLLAYIVWEVAFSLVKLVVWQETEAVLFAGVALFVLAPLLLAPATRRHVDARS